MNKENTEVLNDFCAVVLNGKCTSQADENKRENEDPESIVGDQAPKEPEYTEVCGAWWDWSEHRELASRWSC